MLYLGILFTIFFLLPTLFFIFSHLFNKTLISKNIIIRYIIFTLIFSLFVIIQVLSIRHNFFESLNELLFIYLWWYFIFSMYGLYRREHYLRLLEPIKFSLTPIYFYKLIKRGIKIRFIVMKELFLSLSAKDCIIVGIIFIMSYACLRILRACLIYELIKIYGLEEKVTKYLTLGLVVGYEIILWLKQASKYLIKMCKTPLIEAIQGWMLGEMEYTKLKMNAKQISKTAESQKTGLEKLRESVLTMKEGGKKVVKRVIAEIIPTRELSEVRPVIECDSVRIGEETFEIAEMEKRQNSNVVVPSPKIITTMSEFELKQLETRSKSGVVLINEQTGLPNYIISKSGKAVCLLEERGNLVDTPAGFIPFNYFYTEHIEKYLSLLTIKEKHDYFIAHIYEIQKENRYYKLHEQYLKSKKTGKSMNIGSNINYFKYQEEDPARCARYKEIVPIFLKKLKEDLAPDQATTSDQILYEHNLHPAVGEYTNSIVVESPTKKKYNESDAILINNETKEKRSVQFKTTTNTEHLFENLGENIIRYIQDVDVWGNPIPKTDLLVQATHGIAVLVDLNQKPLIDLKPYITENFSTIDKVEKKRRITLVLDSIEKVKLIEKSKFVQDSFYNVQPIQKASNIVNAVQSSLDKIKLAQKDLYNPLKLKKNFLGEPQSNVNINIDLEDKKNKMD